ncbi:hypothetical protein RchiOBHm_Chr2g0102491 [Rosa chinensis]|uniref:Uncharacterized protein n=1 Tax=Rosa chinensis TaxID=74649 RepID=A0A2P6RMM8_ROSCH|nr:hypothetical protein RchiOBHm_Chr2g0102491 [Rosa chinensis]
MLIYICNIFMREGGEPHPYQQQPHYTKTGGSLWAALILLLIHFSSFLSILF